MAVTHDITLDVHKRTPVGQQRVVVRQGETGTQTIKAAITLDGAAYTSPCTGVRLEIMHADGTWARVTAAKSGSTVTCTLPSAALSSHGTCKLAHFVFFTGTSAIESTEGFELRILPAVDTGNEASKNYSDQLEELIRKWTEIESAAVSATAAANSAAQSANANAANANTQANAAKSAAAQANAAARLTKPYFIQGAEPPYADRVDGGMWVETAGTAVRSINRWDSAKQGAALYPSATTYPQSTTFPAPTGEWSKFTV